MPELTVQSQQKKITSLSKKAQLYFLSGEAFARYDKVVSEFSIDKAKVPTIAGVVYKFVGGMEIKDEFLKQVADLTGFSGDRLNSFVSTLMLEIVLPISEENPDVKEKIAQLGVSGKPSDNLVSISGFIRSFITAFPDFVELHTQHRLEHILEEYLTSKLTKDETIVFIMRPLKLGGLEVDDDTAKKIIDEFDARRAQVKFEEIKSEPVKQEPIKQTKPKDIHAFTEKDAEEIKQVALAKQDALKLPAGLDIKSAVQFICSQKVFVVSDPALQKRCQDIIESRLREARDARQTQDVLERSVSEGGLGISGRKLSDMTQIIEMAVDESKKQAGEKIVTDRAQVQQKKQERIEQSKQLEQKEEQLITKRYIQATGKVPTESVVPVAPKLARSSVAVPANVQMQKQEERIDAKKVRDAVEKTMSQPKPLVVTAKPRVQDISFSRRLSGPIDELRLINLTEFRRLSQEPEQSAQRVKDIFELLEEQGYEKRVQGVQAFRSSPLYQLYSTITQNALSSGISVDEALKQQKQGISALKKQEYDALMKLNADVRF